MNPVAATPTLTRSEHLGQAWTQDISPGERSAIVAWASFATTFAFVRALTHWIRDGHGPSGGGMSVGGRHFHHYNLGIALLTGIGGITIRGAEHHRRHLGTAAAYGTATALIADEAALLIDLQDVYWAKEGRTSVDIAVGIIATGGLAVAAVPLWMASRKRATTRSTTPQHPDTPPRHDAPAITVGRWRLRRRPWPL